MIHPCTLVPLNDHILKQLTSFDIVSIHITNVQPKRLLDFKIKRLQSLLFIASGSFQMCVKCVFLLSLTAVLRPLHLICLWLVWGHCAF